MIKKILFLLFISLFSCTFAQQNQEFANVIKYFNYQRSMLNTEFKKKFDLEPNKVQKLEIKKDFAEFMLKLDSIQNTALIGALIKVKNQESLSSIQAQSKDPKSLEIMMITKDKNEENAEYPGGFEAMRNQISKIFYTESIDKDRKLIKTDINFVVEKDGSISFVKAIGENFTFNRQAEIAMYLLPQRFSPAKVAGNLVRMSYKLPLIMNFE